MNSKNEGIEMKQMIGQDDEQISQYDITKAAHPGICFFHIFFKFCAFFSYLFLGLIIQSTLFQYILIMIFHAFDFYTVKNITGKFLVGLRWYSDFNPRGDEIWRFECFDKCKRSKIDSSVFWTFQFGASCAWAFFLFTNVFSFELVDIMFAGIGASLSWINLWGFYKCSKDQQRKMKGVQSYLTKKGLQMAVQS
ncbi:unnamed protein product [Paramecium sonneborni]|uniref:Golgi apparatus membrane protein TVP23 homolog n=1 Tax=Paramecium sonneborni TaxID=65129 RepID=A0A8S1PBK8_9CILI|nr:unnamed protein product [Paramecium sonneborni]